MKYEDYDGGDGVMMINMMIILNILWALGKRVGTWDRLGSSEVWDQPIEKLCY